MKLSLINYVSPICWPSIFSKKECKMKKELINEIEKKTLDYLQSGFMCGEAIVKVINETFGGEETQNFYKTATAFGGGLAGTKKDICGALVGGVIATGSILGRLKVTDNEKPAFEIAHRYRRDFIKEFGSNNCKIILNSLGKQKDWSECKKLTSKAAGMLAAILLKKGINPKNAIETVRIC